MTTGGIKISDLDVLTAFGASAEFPVNYLGTTYRGSAGQLATWLLSAYGVNRPPTAIDQSVLAFDTATVLTGSLKIGASDPDGDPIAVASVSYGGTNVPIGAAFNAAYGVFYVDGVGGYSYTLGSTARALNTGDVEHEIFTYVIADGKGGIATQHLTITITGTNSAPIVSSVNGSTPMNQVLSGNLLYRLAFDYETTVTVGSFTIAGVGGTQTVGSTATIPGVGTLSIAANGDYTFTPLTGFVGPAPLITYQVTDGVNNVPAFLTIAVNPSIAGTQPIVLFTDIVSGPYDDGSGLAAGGAAMHIHGVRLGDPSGLGTTTKVYIGDVEVGAYVVADADPYAKPGFGRQRIAVRVGALAGLTPGQPFHVKVIVGGQESNTDSVFIPNPGRIFYVAQNGNDSTGVIGDPTHPFRLLQSPDRLSGVYPLMRAGDQILVRAGIGGMPWTDTGFSTAWLRFRDATQQGSVPTGAPGTGWIWFMGYPGEVVKYHTNAGVKGGFQGPGEDVTGTTGDYVGFSNFRMDVGGGATRDAGPFNMQYNAQRCRVVGNEIGPWVAGDSDTLNCAGISGEGNFFEILGNHIHDIEGTSALQNHGVYPGTNSYGWTIRFNWIHDITGGSILSFNDSDGGTATFQTPFGVWMGFTNIQIDHNWFENAAKYILSFNDVGAQAGQLDFRFTNNMCIGSGLPPFHFGTTTATSDGLVAFNTIYDCNITASGGNAMVRNDGLQQTPGHSIKFYDNIFAFGPRTVHGTGWMNDTTGFSNGITWSRNLYWVNGDTSAPAPTMDSLAVVGDPKFTNAAGGDFSLLVSSPAINAATQALPAGVLVLDDYTGQTSRSSGGTADLGFYEYQQPTPYYTSAPTFSGGPQVNVLGTITLGVWANTPSGYSRQVKVGGVARGSAVTGTGVLNFTPAVGDERKVLSVDFVVTNGAGSTPYTLNCGTIATGAGAPVNTALPVITGVAQVGQPLHVGGDAWTGTIDGYAIQWIDGTVPIAGATSADYTLQAGNQGDMITAQVIALDSVHGSQVATATPVGPIAAAPADPVIVADQFDAKLTAATANTTLTLPSSIANADVLFAWCISWDQAPDNYTKADTQGHVSADFTNGARVSAAPFNDNPHGQFFWVRSNASGAYSLTVNQNGGQNGSGVLFAVRGADPTTILDITQEQTQGTGTAIALTGTIATTKANDLILCGVGWQTPGQTITLPEDSGWEQVGTTIDGTYNGCAVFAHKASATETPTFAATLSGGGYWVAQFAAVKGGL